MKKILWVVGITYAALTAHFAIAELTKLTDNRWATWILVFCVLDSVSIGWAVWKAMKKAEAARSVAARPGAEPSTRSSDTS
jgi:hypothetical protein